MMKLIRISYEEPFMTIDGLRCFCAIVDTGSFRAAAEVVHRSQPAVSQQLKSLEREVGHTLIDRKLGRPTPLGELFAVQAREVLQRMDALGKAAQDFDDTVGRELRVGASDTTAIYTLPSVVRQFAEAAPHTRLMLTSRSSDAIAQQVLRGELDFGLVTLPQAHPELEEEALFEQRLVLAVPEDHRLAGKRRIRLDQLRDEAFLLIEAQTRTGILLRDYFHAQDFSPQIVLDSSSFEVIKRYTTEGVGISFLPEPVIGPQDPGLATAHVHDLPTIPIGAIWRRNAYHSNAEKLFLSLLREE
jgi:DNA-binding transcriptional LysR family regulator